MLPFSGMVALVLAMLTHSPSATFNTSMDRLKGDTEIRLGRSFMATETPMLAPMGYIVFCTRNRARCLPSDGPSSVRLTAAGFEELVGVNRSVNHSIKPRRDVGVGFDADHWDIAPDFGDCKDYALTKLHMLIERGWPARTLRLALAQTPTGEGHAVLVVRTTRGDIVLDNRSNAVVDWRSTDLFWIGLQSDSNPKYWNRVSPGASLDIITSAE
jgi:predicted transglutaminase-like cysteine proteinase